MFVKRTYGTINLKKLTTPRMIAGNNDVPDITTKMMKIFMKTSLTNIPIPPVLKRNGVRDENQDKEVLSLPW